MKNKSDLDMEGEGFSYPTGKEDDILFDLGFEWSSYNWFQE